MLRALVFGLTTAAATSAIAHVAPAVSENNRYIKLAPMGDRIRLAYTVYYGQIPGQAERSAMDENGDGRLSEEERDAFGRRVAELVGEGLEITSDGRKTRAEWDQIYVGLGEPTTQGAAFSVDLVAWVCTAPGRDRHELAIADRVALDRPGEGEVRLDTQVGTEILRSGFRDGDLQPLATWTTGSDPFAAGPFVIAYNVDPNRAVFADDERCGGEKTPWSLLLIGGITAAMLVAGAIAFVVARKRQRKS